MVKCGNVLVAARGSSLDSFDIFDGSLLSTWSYPSSQGVGNGQPVPTEVTTKLATQNSESSSVEIIVDAASPPAKKRKLSASEPADAKQHSKEGKKKQNNRSDAVASGLEAPAVIALAVTNGGQHVIAVTGEDKTIRVFENIREDGVYRLRQLSQRQVISPGTITERATNENRAMPKRPCALAITDDNSAIISADKFGDVYSLPLIPLETLEAPKSTYNTPEPSVKTFTPAANELTIHSQRNRKALENQRRQTNKTSEKPEPIFEHKLLLGHVSMLTDIALVTLGNRNYIITADRDEHIRVSRGIPQTHIIEGFCLGHTEFISRIYVPADRPELLISGGGDDEIFVWEWESGTLVSKMELKKYVLAALREFDKDEGSDIPAEQLKIAVSGIYHTRQTFNDSLQDIIVVTCEG
jgi:tRNA (guanine-N(7)-)-methyltransferase subunit TRM82